MVNTKKALLGTAAALVASLVANLVQMVGATNKDAEISNLNSNVAVHGLLPPTLTLESIKAQNKASVVDFTDTHAEIDTVMSNYEEKIPTVIFYKDSSVTNPDGSVSGQKTQLARYVLK